jgi:hypothetical protein
VAAVVIAFEAIRRTRTPQGAVGWTVFLFAWPMVAVPLYLLFGYSRVQSYAEARREADHGLPDGSEAALPPAPAEAARLAEVAAVALHPVTRGNAARLLPKAEAAFEAMLAAIDGAERYVLLQFYIVRDDEIGRRFAEALVRAAARGVRVRVILDAVGTLLLPPRYGRGLREGGVELRFQRGPARPLGRFGLNFRNHRKILVVDGREGFTGGLNLGASMSAGATRRSGCGVRSSSSFRRSSCRTGTGSRVSGSTTCSTGAPRRAGRHDRRRRRRSPDRSARQRRALLRGARADGAGKALDRLALLRARSPRS